MANGFWLWLAIGVDLSILITSLPNRKLLLWFAIVVWILLILNTLWEYRESKK